MRGSGLSGALVAVLLGVTACSGSPSADPSPSRSSTSSGAVSPSPTTEGNGEMVPSLPALSSTPPASPVQPGGTPKSRRTFGADFSWPQCPKGMGIPEKRSEGAPLPTDAARFVVVGLTNGPSFVANPCLADQLEWVKERHLLAAAYSVVSYPDAHTLAELAGKGPYDGSSRLGALRNVGYQAAMFNVDTMRRVGFRTPVVWIDVEPVTHFDWSADVVANGAVVQGMARGYRDAGFRIGFYSIASLWTRVVGPLRFGDPEWRPAGARGLGEALNRCGDDWSFQGGKAVLGQWVEDGRDRNVTCPGAMPDLREWFHQY
jgi:hypothetical protein